VDQDVAAPAAGLIPAEVLLRIPGCEDGRPPRAVSSLPGGRGCNQVLRVDTAQGRFVWRRRFLPIDRPGSRAIDELRAQQLAAGARLAPAVLAAHPEGHWLLMEFIDAPVWSVERLHTDEGAARLAGQLARLQGLQVPAGWPPVDAVAMADAYVARLATFDPGVVTALAPLRDRIAAISASIAALSLQPVPHHGDLSASNLLGDEPLLVDWEYAQVAEPGWDLACLLTYYPGMARFLPRLLVGGLAGLAPPLLELQRERFALLDRLWGRLSVHEGG
jgi:aminoglycoside phosphotransferase (APT) family kinase protein